MGKGIVDGVAHCTTIAYDFALFYERREELRWALADICALLGTQDLRMLAGELQNNFGISITHTSLENYARVARAFPEKHRHLQYKWSNFLEWSKHEDPIEAMEFALDNGYSPTQMARLRRYGDPEYKKPKPEACQVCGGDILHCRHEDFANIGDGETKGAGSAQHLTDTQELCAPPHPRDDWNHLGTVEYPDGERQRVDDEG